MFLSAEVEAIVRRAGMREYVPPPFSVLSEGEAKRRRRPTSTRTRNVGHYSIIMTRIDGSCMIKFYENLEDWRRKLRAVWNGLDKVECDRKFEQVVETAVQVRYEYKMGKI